MAPAQPTFSDLEASSGRVTRRRRFLGLLDSKIPWGAWAARVEPHYPKAGGGRPPVPLGTMLRMYVAQVAFQLSDEGTEDALWDSAAVRSFVGCGDSVPDATTLCRFRSLLAANGLGRALLDELNASLEAEGLRMSAGTIVDATFVEAPSSTKNARKQRDPEAHQAKKGQNWHFGYKAHVGVDAVAGTVHTLEVTAANVSDLARAASLVRPGDADVWADSGYTGVSKWVGGTPAASARWHVARRKKSVPESERPQESMLASARALASMPSTRSRTSSACAGPGTGARRRWRTSSMPRSPSRTACSPRAGRPCRGRRPARRTACACAPSSWGSSGRPPRQRRGRGGAPWPPDMGGTRQKSPGGPSRAGFSAPAREGLQPRATCSLFS